MNGEQYNAVPEMPLETYEMWQERKMIAGFCNCSLMAVEAMPETDYKLWLNRAVAFSKTQMRRKAEMQALEQAQQEERQVLRLLNGRG